MKSNMKILLRIYNNSYLGNCKTESVEIPSNSILVKDFKEIIAEKINIKPSQQKLTTKKENTFITMEDESSLSSYDIKNNSSVHLDRIVTITNADKIKNKIIHSKNTKLKYLSSLGFYTQSQSKGRQGMVPMNKYQKNNFLSPITESVVEYSEENITGDKNKVDKIIELTKSNDIEQFKDCLNHFEIKDINTIGEKGFNLLQSAVFYGYYLITDYLINDCQADVNIPNEKGWTPLYLAVCKQKEQCVGILMGNKNIDPNINIKTGEGTALHLACKMNNWRIVSLLLHKANPK
ncbi:MAG: ankyrin repeat domain-containing protein [archaeon]|nr:ankyrin repeat domain-containing protein [archaeon]